MRGARQGASGAADAFSWLSVVRPQVFRDPTIDKEEDKQLMTSATQRAFAWDEHKEYETRHAPLCPEYCLTRSVDAKWAENALANGVKVFLSSKNGLKPKKSE
jgi:hypothetical protein